MTIELSFATFTTYQGKTFAVSREGFPTLALELVEIGDLRIPGRKLPSNVRQDPFNLLLRGPLEPILPQGIYTFTEKDLGSIELFLVPTGPQDGSCFYNIVVN